LSITSASGNTLPAQASSKNGNELLEKKISNAIEIFDTTRFCELILRQESAHVALLSKDLLFQDLPEK